MCCFVFNTLKYCHVVIKRINYDFSCFFYLPKFHFVVIITNCLITSYISNHITKKSHKYAFYLHTYGFNRFFNK